MRSKHSAPHQEAAIGQPLQQALQQRLETQALQFRCAVKDQTLLVLAEHLLHLEPDIDQTFASLETAIRALVPEMLSAEAVTLQELPVQMFLRIAGYQQPYASQQFRFEFPEAPSQALSNYSYLSEASEATTPTESVAKSVAAAPPVEPTTSAELIEPVPLVEPQITAEPVAESELDSELSSDLPNLSVEDLSTPEPVADLPGLLDDTLTEDSLPKIQLSSLELSPEILPALSPEQPFVDPDYTEPTEPPAVTTELQTEFVEPSPQSEDLTDALFTTEHEVEFELEAPFDETVDSTTEIQSDSFAESFESIEQSVQTVEPSVESSEELETPELETPETTAANFTIADPWFTSGTDWADADWTDTNWTETVEPIDQNSIESLGEIEPGDPSVFEANAEPEPAAEIIAPEVFSALDPNISQDNDLPLPSENLELAELGESSNFGYSSIEMPSSEELAESLVDDESTNELTNISVGEPINTESSAQLEPSVQPESPAWFAEQPSAEPSPVVEQSDNLLSDNLNSDNLNNSDDVDLLIHQLTAFEMSGAEPDLLIRELSDFRVSEVTLPALPTPPTPPIESTPPESFSLEETANLDDVSSQPDDSVSESIEPVTESLQEQFDSDELDKLDIDASNASLSDALSNESFDEPIAMTALPSLSIEDDAELDGSELNGFEFESLEFDSLGFDTVDSDSLDTVDDLESDNSGEEIAEYEYEADVSSSLEFDDSEAGFEDLEYIETDDTVQIYGSFEPTDELDIEYDADIDLDGFEPDSLELDSESDRLDTAEVLAEDSFAREVLTESAVLPSDSLEFDSSEFDSLELQEDSLESSTPTFHNSDDVESLPGLADTTLPDVAVEIFDDTPEEILEEISEGLATSTVEFVDLADPEIVQPIDWTIAESDSSELDSSTDSSRHHSAENLLKILEAMPIVSRSTQPPESVQVTRSARPVRPAQPVQSSLQATTESSASDSEQSTESPDHSRQHSTPNLVLSGTLGMSIVIGGLYMLTRPCVIGRCEQIQQAQQLSMAALQTARTTESALDVVGAYKQLSEANYLLSTIPIWSGQHAKAQTLLASYEDQSVALKRVVEALEQANKTTRRSQNPPHPLPVWREIQWSWREVIEGLEQIPSNNPVYGLVQRKLQEYRANLSDINHRVASEQQAQERVAAARKVGELAQSQAEAAKSPENWQETASNWTTAIQQLQRIPEGTIAHAEAQQLLALYQPKLTQANVQRTQEQEAAAAYAQALSLAEQARRLEQQNQWVEAAEQWRDALNAAQQIPSQSTYYSQVQPLLGTYAKTLQQAQETSQRVGAIQLAKSNFDQVCAGSPKICTYTLSPQAIRVQFTSLYDQTVTQLIANNSPSKEFPPATVNQVNELLRSLADMSETTQVPVELYNSNGSKLGTYRPSVSGYSTQQ